MAWSGKNLVVIRPAKIEDLDQITDVYNEAILKTVATFDTKIKTSKEQKKWFEQHGKKNLIIVAEENDVIVGWAALSKYSTRCAYSETAEISLYVLESFQGRRVGKQLMKEIVKAGKKAGLHVLLARITDGNKISIHMHESFGFEHIGIMKEVGFKFGKRLDVYLMQKIL